MLTTLPAYTSLREGQRRGGALPPLALVLRVSPQVDVTDPATLLRRCVAVTATCHPMLDRLLLEAGARAERGSYVLTVPTDRPPDAAAVAALTAVHPAAWRSGGRSAVADTLGEAVLAAMAGAGAEPATGRPKRIARMGLRVTRSGAKLRLTPMSDGLRVAEADIGVGAGHRLLLTPADAVAVVAAARAAGIVVTHTDTHRRLADLQWLVDRSCVLTAVTSAPGWANVMCGPLVSAPAAGPVRAADAVAMVRRIRGDVAVAVDVDTMQAAAAAAAVGTGRSGLRPWQDRFVSAYLAAGPGMVNALPPGSGKTVCAAAAMAERAGEVGGYRAVVLAPASLRVQWGRELARFFPAAQVAMCAAGSDFAALLETWADAGADPVVAVLTPQLAARTGAELSDLRPTDLVVDEATFLRRPGTAQAAAAWRLRDRSRHAMVLTGTPDGHGLDEVGALVAFARGRRDLFDPVPLSQPHPHVSGDRVGPLLYRGPSAGVGELPAAHPTRVAVAPGHAETQLDKVARDRVATLLAGADSRRGAPRLRTELDAWRLGLACPAALLRSRHGFAAAARQIGVAAEPGVKVTWTVQRVAAAVGAGEQVLVFSDFPAALEVTAQLLTAAGVAAAVLSSTVPARRRQQTVDAFVAGDLPVLLVAATGQLGLNLQTAARVVHLDVPTSAATLLQRTARAARLGSTRRSVAVEVPVLDGCGDDALLRRLQGQGPVADLWELAADLLAP